VGGPVRDGAKEGGTRQPAGHARGGGGRWLGAGACEQGKNGGLVVVGRRLGLAQGA
jgi:hypothetical protein